MYVVLIQRLTRSQYKSEDKIKCVWVFFFPRQHLAEDYFKTCAGGLCTSVPVHFPIKRVVAPVLSHLLRNNETGSQIILFIMAAVAIRTCESPGCQQPAKLQCPTCIKLGIQGSFFCAQVMVKNCPFQAGLCGSHIMYNGKGLNTICTDSYLCIVS